MGQVGSSLRVVVLLGFGSVAPVMAQELSLGNYEEAGPAISRWLDLVRSGAAETARQIASPRFKYRLSENAWREWVEKTSSGLRELRPRRVVETMAGRSEPPLEPISWVRVVLSSERPAGGKVYQRITAVREDDGVWRVADYGAWADGEAMVNNAAVESIPYRILYSDDDYWDGWREWFFSGGRADRPPPEPVDRGSARANPRTFPRRPPA